MTNENADFWLGRWQRGETGWHQDKVEPALVTWAAKRKPTRILVPLCGKSLDLIWLAANGFEVIGVELSELACEALFLENEIHFEKSLDGAFTVFSAPGLKIFNGDFFKLSSQQIGIVGAVYDRAALIALPPELRARYARHLCQIIDLSLSSQPEFGFLQLVIERTPHDLTGPPFSVTLREVEALYGKRLEIELQSKEAVTAKAPTGSRTDESILYLKPH